MNTPFERVGLIGKSGDRNVSAALQALTALLERHRLQILLDEGIADMLAGRRLPGGYAVTSWPCNATSPSWSAATVPC